MSILKLCGKLRNNMFEPINNSKNVDRKAQDLNSDKILSLNHSGQTFGLSLFGKGFPVNDIFSDIFKSYDVNRDKFLDGKELETFKKDLLNAAGDDSILSDEELNKFLTKSENTTEFSEKSSAIFKTFITVMKNGLKNLNVQSYDDYKLLTSINEDGSGVRLSFFQTDKGDGYKAEFLSKGGKTKEIISSTNALLGKDSSYMDSYFETKNVTSHVTYNDEGLVVKQSHIYQGDDGIPPYIKASTFYYDENNNLISESKMYTNCKSRDNTTVITSYRDDGSVKDELNLSEKAGLSRTELTNYGLTKDDIESKYIRDEKDDEIVTKHYEGANLSNRLGYLPSKIMVYDKKSGTLKSVEINKFDRYGSLISKIREDKINGTSQEFNYSDVNGVIESSFQGGIGDCFFLETLNTLSQRSEGRKILKDSIKIEKTIDENGSEHTNYIITLNGVNNVLKDLNSGIRNFPKEKIFIQPQYVITEEEFEQAKIQAGKNYSSGDKDVLLHEIAYSKYRKDVAKTMTANGESFFPGSGSGNLIAGLDIARNYSQNPEEIGNGGVLGLTMYLYTGKKSDAYFSTEVKHPACSVDAEGNLKIVEGSLSYWNSSLVKEPSNVFHNRYKDIDEVISILKSDTSKNGTFKSYVAEASIPVTTQNINGVTVTNGDHAFTIKGIKDDKVILINPWDSTKEVEISISDFSKSAKMVNILKL